MLGRILRGLFAFPPAPAPVAPAGATPVPLAEPADLPGLPFQIRPATAGDLPGLARVFREAILRGAAREYSDPQRRAWVAKADAPEFLDMLRDGTTVLAENRGEPVAFAQLAPASCIRMLYVDPDWSGLGIATLLCQYLEDEARIAGSRELEAHASHSSRRFFESMGYRPEGEDEVRFGSELLGRTLMRKKLGR